MRALLLLALLTMGAAPLTVTVAGPPVTVFSHATDACDADDIPDAPARAIRLDSGEVLLFAPHFHNRLLRGANLLSVHPDCRIVFAGAENDDPAAFDDRGWLVSPYTQDGRTIVSVVHDEFQGHRRPWLCPTRRYLDCWYNALTLTVSTDAAHSFARPKLLAALPYRYDEVVGAHRGYFNPSNIVAYAGAFYMLAFATDARAQRSGSCLLRTDVLADPQAWRAWDGTRFVDPYDNPSAPDTHVCAPVGVGALRWPVTSLVRHAPSGLFIATMQDAATGVYISTSADLQRWRAPVLIWSASGMSGWHCGGPKPVAYPSLLDPDSPTRSFETVGAHAMLFLTRFNLAGCRLGMDRDLVRLPVTITAAANPAR